jgi:glycosyltransferase involved in cell wall biosynthesis
LLSLELSFGFEKEKFVLTKYAPAISTQVTRTDSQDTNVKNLGLEPGYMFDVASNSERKNIINLLDAVASLQDMEIEVPKLVIAGDWQGSETHRYGKKILGDNVFFTGYVDDDILAELYHSAGMYVNPTRHEAFGLTNLEAMAAGLPVITSNTFAVPEVVGDAALLIDEPENINEIAEKIRYLLENPNKKAILAEQSQERAKEYTWQNTVDTILSAFRDLS